MSVRPIPEGYHSVTPYLTVAGVRKLIDVLREAFGAVVVERMEQPDGGIRHAEVRLGDTVREVPPNVLRGVRRHERDTPSRTERREQNTPGSYSTFSATNW